MLIAGASAVFIAAYIVDTAAVARLLLASLRGNVGQPARMAAIALLLLLLGVIACAVYRPGPPPGKARTRAVRPSGRNKDEHERIEALDSGPGRKKARKAPRKTASGLTP